MKKMRDNGIEPTNPAYQKMQTNLNNTKEASIVKIVFSLIKAQNNIL